MDVPLCWDAGYLVVGAVLCGHKAAAAICATMPKRKTYPALASIVDSWSRTGRRSEPASRIVIFMPYADNEQAWPFNNSTASAPRWLANDVKTALKQAVSGSV